MKVKFGSIVASASGSVGGCTYSRNRFGPYVRNRSLPVNPNSASQVTIRQIFADLAIAWNVDLDASERAAWKAYADNVPTRTDPVLGPIFGTGMNAFIAANAPRIQFGGAVLRIDAAPVIFNKTELNVVTGLSDVNPPDETKIAHALADEWNDAVGGYLFVSYAPPVNQTVNFYKGPFRFTDTIEAISAATPFTGATPFPASVGQRVFCRIIASTPDGRLSVPKITFFDVV